MSNALLEILIILMLIVLNGLLAMSEISVVSARKSRLQQRAEDGDRKSARALDLANHPNRFLSTVQIGITLVGILAGAYGGATLSARLAEVLRTYSFLAPYADALSLGVVVICITFLSLVIGELVPKRIGMHWPEGIARAMAGPMHFASIMMAPLVHLLSWATDLVLRLIGVRGSREDPITEEEIAVLIAQGTEAGVIEEAEQDIVERVFRLGDQAVNAVMTPRTEIQYLDVNDPPEDNQAKLAGKTHTRFVVCRDGLDHVLGIVHVKHLLAQRLEGSDIDLTTALLQPHYVPESLQALRVLELFRTTGVHIALVVDEYGGIAGLVTLDDILEALVGDIPWSGEPIEPAVVEREDGSWLIDGMTPIEEFKDLLDIRTLPGEDRIGYRTVGGFIVTHLGRIPAAADFFTWERWRIEVMDMDGNRVDKVLVREVPEEAGSES